ncbi:MAG TPA: exopolyphosphatase, partial [Burkholderiales bacterium]|nr:exopolyphosphatase [Burkholderiales bacterium]
AVLSELDIEVMTAATGAMREGILYDLLGRVHHQDLRDVTVAQFMQRYHVDALQARRVGALAEFLYGQLTSDANGREKAQQYLGWASKLHEAGISVAYSGYHKHTAYILEKADMPGFSRDEQKLLSLLALAHRRSLKKILPQLEDRVDWCMVLALRLAVLLYRRRTDVGRPVLKASSQGRRFRVTMDSVWLLRHPLTAAVLREEIKEWEKIGFELAIPGLERAEPGSDVAATG